MPWSCGPTSPRRTTTSASPCAKLGRRDEALEHFRRAVELEPAFAPARTNLGQMLLDRGQAEEALPHCQEAVRLAAGPARRCTTTWAMRLRALDRLVEARAAYLEALRLDPELALSHAHLGLILQKEGQLDDALVWLKQAVELEPANATFWEILAELQDEREEPGEAIPCWERVLALATEERPGPHLSLGWALQEEGRLAEAGEHYRTALALEPELGRARSSTWAGSTKSWARWPRPRRPSARRCGCSRTTPCRTPGWRPCCAASSPTPTCAALEARLADPRLEPGRRARLLFALAHVLDARGEYRPRRRLPPPGQRPDAWSWPRAGATTSRPSTSASSTACSARSAPSSSRDGRDRAWRRAGRCSSSACRGRGRR